MDEHYTLSSVISDRDAVTQVWRFILPHEYKTCDIVCDWTLSDKIQKEYKLDAAEMRMLC